MAPTQEAPTRDGTISGWATPGILGGAMAVIDAAHDIGGMPPLIREEDAGVASPSAYPLLEEGPLTPRAASPGFRFLISSSSTTVSHGSCPGKLFLDRDTCQSRDPNLAPQADCVLLSDTFYLSPLVSRSSGFFSLRSSDSGTETHDARSIMPGQIFDAPTEHRFPSSTTSGYFALTDDAADPRFDGTTQLPPCSAESGKSDRTASPLNFACWAKRQHHTHKQDRHKEEQGSSKRNVLSRSSSTQKRQAQAAVPQMTREEFEALPLAIQRKYFSTLERLRFAQDACLVEGISQHYDDISNFKRRNPRRDRSPSEDVVGRSRRGSVAELHSSASDSPPLCAGLQEATREEKPCREDKARPAMRHRASVILDAADEAVYKFNKQANRRNPSTTVDVLTPPLSPSRHSMDSQDSLRKDVDQSANGHVPRSFFESFRWLDEEEDLDLRLFLDDYHANLREGTPTTKQRPSFRRRISISKIPFGRRNSVSSADPVTREAVAPTKSPPIRSSSSDGPSHARRKSRALSLIAPKHVSQPPVAAIDPSAAHYQDPEARLKLRVYLASPQKFDEAVEFGFPSTDVLSAASPFNADGGGLSGQTKQRVADASLDMQTFLADQDEDEEDIDNVSLYSDHASVADPDSPKTPEPLEHRTTGPRHARFASATLLSGRDIGRKTPEGAFYAQAPATSREMTLRMTLTRPDLRAHEDEIYGWQQQKYVYQQHARRPTALASLAAENRVAYNGNGAYNSLEKFPELDHWNGTTTEKGVIRRIWNRVRRG
ncbi:hypothetical protein MYCTH_2076293 [Thermothelomyces thermophilus ATCC 42464]|uniref:Uncharacterized protein n=1 Tax=Thermothelomyces thermophilus (strain ATCC 42464 / BCRC 31852 / DSM 1799) TaxID=573729 RepID=G2Q384_THET4|nr:uncharacterized protein MYCTH_2076293 [Thermothelomyces thermophilus ATCC 42464]AEO54345.1 hypothetical protein MYCTH_2076293 [Thermothelomyces thermophilus ATCC 42464]